MSYAFLNIFNLLFILSLVSVDTWGLDSGITYFNLDKKILENIGWKLPNIWGCACREDPF